MTAPSILTADPYSMLTVKSLGDLYEYARLARGLDGCVVECGVANGGSAAVLWDAVGVKRRLWLFDSFEGLPEPTEPDGGRAFAKYAATRNRPEGWCKGDVGLVCEVLDQIGDRQNVTIVPGWLENTIQAYSRLIGPIAALHLDVDFYEPTLLALTWLHPLVVPGGVVIVDDYGAWQGCRVAVDEFLGGVEVDDYHQIDSPVYWRKKDL